jgi:hypothetical protein
MAFSIQSMVRGFVLLAVIATMTEYAEAERNASFDRKQWTWCVRPPRPRAALAKRRGR